MSLHSDTLFWFRANQSLLFLFNAACLADKQQMTIFSLWFDPTGARTHDLPHLRRTRYLFRHRRGVFRINFRLLEIIYVIWVCLCIVISITYYAVCLSCLSSSCLWIFLSWLTLRFSLTFILNVLYYIVVDISNTLEGTNISNSNSTLNCAQCMLNILILLEYINVIGPGWLNELGSWIT